MDLDDLLARSAPPTTSRSPDLDRTIADLVEETGPRRRRGGAVAVGVAIVVGLGGVTAVASEAVPGWFPFTSDIGQRCRVGLEAVTVRGPQAPTASDGVRRRVEQVATQFLRDLDLDEVDAHDTLQRLRTMDEGDPSLPDESATDEQVRAVTAQAQVQLDERLSAQDLPVGLVLLGRTWRCE